MERISCSLIQDRYYFVDNNINSVYLHFALFKFLKINKFTQYYLYIYCRDIFQKDSMADVRRVMADVRTGKNNHFESS